MLPPSGPAMPVVDRPIFVLYFCRIPFAISLATSLLTAPFLLRIFSETPKSEILTSLLYAIIPP